MATTVTTAHHSIWRHLYDSIHAAQKPKNKLKFVTLDKESNISTLWRREEFQRISSKEEKAEKAQDAEDTICICLHETYIKTLSRRAQMPKGLCYVLSMGTSNVYGLCRCP